jgi:membrane protease YdiL (CAAX protease family)
VSLSAAIFLGAVGVVLPLLAYASKRRLDAGLSIVRLPFYAEAILLQLVLLAGAYWVATLNRITPFGKSILAWADLAAGIAVFLLTVAAMEIAWRFTDARSRQRLLAIVPSSDFEKTVWVGLAAAAAIAEEVTYRGVMVAILNRLTHDWWIAAAIASLLFALAHLAQGWSSAAAILAFAFVFHLLVQFTGTLLVAIAVHFAYDVLTGFVLSARRAPAPSETL